MPRKIRPIRIEGDVAYVPLTQGCEAIIDAADVHLVEGWNWYALVKRRRGNSASNVYAARNAIGPNGVMTSVYLHRVIAETSGGISTDHRDGDGLNNRRSNLRQATHAENMRNCRKASNNTSGIKGVCWSTWAMKWRARIKVDGRNRHLGYFTTIEAAAAAYAEASGRLHGEFGRTE